METPHYRIPIDSLGSAAALFSTDGVCARANEEFCTLIGYSKKQLHRVRFDALWPEKCLIGLRAARQNLLNRVTERHVGLSEVLTRDGTPVPVAVTFSLDGGSVGNERPHFLLLLQDLRELQSARDALQHSESARHQLARKLTDAQENERLRIARELHDDIGQWLAILRIQFLRAGQPVSGMPGKRHPTVAELCGELQKLAEKVSRLSHQLHSPELEYLGLASAVQSHCREFSEKYKTAVNCSCSDLPKDMDGLLALGILRVVQEALHNAAKHSRAEFINVELEATEGQMRLRISDNGRGFDPEEARFAAGLGLISMRERIHLAGGEFSIWSRPGEGTRIEAQVPLARKATSAS